MDENIQRILIVKPSSLGDIIHTFPAISLLVKYYPEIKIDWIVNPEFAEVLSYCPNINRKILFQRKKLANIKKIIPEFSLIYKEIRKVKYDVVIDFQGLIRSAFFARIANSQKFVGFSECKEGIARIFYNRKYHNINHFQHAIEKNLSLVFQLLNKTYEKCDFDLVKNQAVHNEIVLKLQQKNILYSKDVIIGIVPGARWHSKTWPPTFFVEIINSLLLGNKQLKFVLIGSKGDMEIEKKILANVDGNSVKSMIGKTSLIELVELIRTLSVVITNDSGPMHIVAALNIDVFAFFGSTDPDKTGPYGDNHTILSPNLDCIKCFKRYCPNGQNKCHTSIKVEDVVNKVKKRLEIYEKS